MNTQWTVVFTPADLIPILTGLMIFISVLMAKTLGEKAKRYRQVAWTLGLISQLILVAFGWLTGYYGFATHVLIAGAFAWNMWSDSTVAKRRYMRRRIKLMQQTPDPLKTINLNGVYTDDQIVETRNTD